MGTGRLADRLSLALQRAVARAALELERRGALIAEQAFSQAQVAIRADAILRAREAGLR